MLAHLQEKSKFFLIDVHVHVYFTSIAYIIMRAPQPIRFLEVKVDMTRKKGLLIAPEFPADSFWSYKHVVKYVRRKAAFPPLGLLTFAAQLPRGEWDLELVDLNVSRPSAKKLRRQVQAADAVFAGAMNIQRESLVELFGKIGETDTPWVLGGPMASTYRDTILQPRTESDHVLHAGLDFLVWGESQPWIEPLAELLEAHPLHSGDTPRLLIPERVATESEGSRKYLRDASIFNPRRDRRSEAGVGPLPNSESGTLRKPLAHFVRRALGEPAIPMG